MITTVQHLEPGDMVSWGHNGMTYELTVTSIGFAHMSLEGDSGSFFRNEQYDGRTTFTVHNRDQDLT